MFRRSLLLTIILSFFALLYAGCPQQNGKCESVRDCKKGEACTNGICQKVTSE
jgi:hypothetical protein